MSRVTACFSINSTSKLVGNLNSPLFFVKEENGPHLAKRLHMLQPESQTEDDTSSQKEANCFIKEKIKERLVELPQPAFSTNRLSTMNLKILSSLIALYKKGQICFPHEVPAKEKEMIVFSPLLISRKHPKDGLHVVPSAYRIYGGSYTAKILLVPFRRNAECCPFYPMRLEDNTVSNTFDEHNISVIRAPIPVEFTEDTTLLHKNSHDNLKTQKFHLFNSYKNHDTKFKTMKNMQMSLLFILLFLILSACTVGQMGEYRPVSGFALQDSLNVSYHVDKVSYLPADRTFFILNRTENTVRIYKRGGFFNEIGGSGFANDHFRRLADICVGLDGSLYTLDNFEKVIKRFDKDGNFINQVHLKNISSPEKFAMTSFGSIYVYDSHSKEIFALDAFDMSVSFTFGKFQIDRADAFFITGDFINIFDINNKETTIYHINGLYENTFSGYIFYDTFKNLFSLSQNTFSTSRENIILFSSTTNFSTFHLERDFYVFVTPTFPNHFTNQTIEPFQRHPNELSVGSGSDWQIKVFRGLYDSR